MCLLTFHLHQQVAADSTNRAVPAATLANLFAITVPFLGGSKFFFLLGLDPAIGGPEQDLSCIMFNVFVERTRHLEL
jgi:hypothetical protein